MESTNNNDATSDSEPAGKTKETEEYSRRSFMETAAAAGAVGGTAGLAGCLGEGSNSGGGKDGGTDSTGEQDFLWWTMRGYIPAETKGIKRAARDFEDAADANVNVSTEVVTWDSVFQEWEAGLQGRSLPDVSEMAGEHAVDFGYRRAAEPLTDLFNQYNDWYDVISNWQKFQGEQWAMPWFMEMRTTHINRNLMDEAGVNGIFETWEDIVTKGQAIMKNSNLAGAWTIPGGQDVTTGQNVSAMNFQAGGEWYGYNNGEWSVEADSAASLFTHLWVMSMREQWNTAPGGWGGIDSTSNQELYQSGEVAAAHLPADLARTLIDPQNGVNEDYADIAEATELTPMPTGPNGESHSFMGGSVFGSFTDKVTQNSAGTRISKNFINYMTLPENLSKYFPVSAPIFMPVRTGQEEMKLFTNNPTEIPDSWLDTRLAQAPQTVRYGITGAGRSAPFLGSLEGSTEGYSIPISSMLGNDADPKETLREMGNNMRSTINRANYVDQTLENKSSGPSLDNAPDIVQDWITGNGKPKIWNPYE